MKAFKYTVAEDVYASHCSLILLLISRRSAESFLKSHKRESIQAAVFR